MVNLIQAPASGILIGLVYSLVALALTLIWEVVEIVNFSHGDFLMIAMYLVFTLYAAFHLDLIVSLPMVAIGRALMSRPRLLMLDEPSLGLMPLLVDSILEILQRLNRERWMTILLVEQNVREALEIAHQGYVIQSGKIIAEEKGQKLLESDLIRQACLGI